MTDLRMMRILHLATIGEKVLGKQTAKPKPKPKPVPKVGGGQTPTSGPREDQSIDAWMKARNQQLKKRRA